MRITVITFAKAILNAMALAHKQLEAAYPGTLTLQLFDVKGPIFSEEKRRSLEQAVSEADLIVVDLRLVPEEWVEKIHQMLQCASERAHIIDIMLHSSSQEKTFKLGQLNADDLRELLADNGKPPSLFIFDQQEMVQQFKIQLSIEKQNDFENLIAVIEYWMYANEDHLMQLLIFLVREYGRDEKAILPEPYRPLITDEIVIYDQESRKAFHSLQEFADTSLFDATKPTVGIIFLGYHIHADNMNCVHEVIARLKRIANVVPLLVSTVGRIQVEVFKKLVENDKTKVSLLVNFVPFRLGSGPMGGNSDEMVPMLEELGIPLLHPFFMTKRTVHSWKESIQGIDSSDYLTSVMLPELDGALHTFPIGGLTEAETDPLFDFEMQKLVLIEERVDELIARIDKLLSLQRKKNKEKKIAIICYNYPPGEENMFGASYIDTFASVPNLLEILKNADYDVPTLTKEELIDYFGAGKLVNSGRWSGEETYRGFIRYPASSYRQTVTEHLLDAIMKNWGEAPGEIMTEEADFLIPGIERDNLFIGLQPARSGDHLLTDSYHDKTLPPHHQYVAFYSWLKEEFKADAIIHVGTHGTVEFLQGKEVAMSGDCFPDQLIGSLPHIYIYYIGNPSEAMIAKRRTHATLVSYLTPPYIVGDLYGDYVQLEEQLANHAEAEKLDPMRAKRLEQDIMARARKLHFTSNDLHEIEMELYRMKRSLIPKGLHIFGKGYTEEDAKNYMRYVLRYDHKPLKAVKRIIAESKGLSYDELLQTPNKEMMEQLEIIENVLIDRYLEERTLHLFEGNKWNEQLQETLEYGLTAYQNSMKTNEETGLLTALQGNYLPVRLAADIVKNPEILPSGSNLYQFDPRQIPEKTAAERGKIIAENTIAQFVKESGTYPKSTGVVLWGFETSRTQGETIGQILHYLGVRIVTMRGMLGPQFEIIPIAELGRPRIDVVINMTGYFRDIFPNVLDDLNKLILQIAKLDEDENDNFIKANTNRHYEELLADGYSEKEAFALASARIFGPTEGAYATRVTSQIGEQSWKEEKELAEGYMKDTQYIYGLEHRGKANEKLLKLQFQTVDLVSQIRSNLELEVIDLDHYYEYFGGFAKSVEAERGIKPPIYISDTTGESILTEGVQSSIERGVRTRLLNPKWIDGLLEHEQHGAQQVLERFENLIGLAATTNKVDSWVFSELHTTYVADEKRRDEFTENNRWAYHRMMERLLESHSRGYWEASQEELQQLTEAYLQLEGKIEEKV